MDIKRKAFQMFRDWTANAKLQFPNYDFTIIDENVLVTDLSKCIQSAVKALNAAEKASKRKRLGYDVGFMLGYIEGSLNKHWMNEYIHKHTEPYKALIALKAIQFYLDFDAVALIKMEHLYQKLFLQDVNIANIFTKPNKMQFSDFGADLKTEFGNNQNKHIAIHLANLILEKAVKIADLEDHSFLPEAEKYFSDKEITDLINGETDL